MKQTKTTTVALINHLNYVSRSVKRQKFGHFWRNASESKQPGQDDIDVSKAQSVWEKR